MRATQQDSPSQVLLEKSVWLTSPSRPSKKESSRGEDCSDHYHQDPNSVDCHPDIVHQLTDDEPHKHHADEHPNLRSVTQLLSFRSPE